MNNLHPRTHVIRQAEAAGHTSLLLGQALIGFGAALIAIGVLSLTPVLDHLGVFLIAGLVGLAFIGMGMYIRSLGRLLESLSQMLALEAGSQPRIGEAVKRGVPDAERIARAVNEVTATLEMGDEDR